MLNQSISQPSVFKPLTTSESHQSLADSLIREDLKIIAEESIAHDGFQNRFSGTISQNMINCRGDTVCSNADTLPQSWSRELARLSFSPDQFYLQHTPIGRITVYCGYTWLLYCLLTGCMQFLLRCKAHFTGPNTANCTMTGLCITCCHNMDAAMNPLSNTRDRLSTRIAETELQVLDSEMLAKTCSRRQDSSDEVDKRQDNRIAGLETKISRLTQRLNKYEIVDA